MRVWAVLVAWGASATAHADATADAQAQFERGRQLLKDGKPAEACAAFEASLRAEFQYGTLYNLGGCNAQQGKLASAWTAYHRLAAEDTNPGRRARSAARADELWPRIPKLVIAVAHPPTGAVYELDGEDVSTRIGAQLPVDPGDHVVSAHAPGFRDFRATAPVAADNLTIDVTVTLEATGVAPSVRHEPVVTVTRHREGHRAAAVVTLIAGPVLMGSSLALSLYEKRVYDDARARNDIPAANHAHDVARYAGTSLFLAGAIALPVGFVLYRMSDTVVVSPVVTGELAAVSLSGRF